MEPGSADNVDALVAEYRDKQLLYEQCTRTFRDLLDQLLTVAGFGEKIVSVTCRPKDRVKLKDKLLKAEKRYGSLSDITDLVGLRVITYFGDDVDEIAALVEREFSIDWDSSVDKRKVLDPDRFGYLSTHYVCELPPKRAQLPEYERFSSLKCEIQVRSILQHAWAEIEHDLGYKTTEAIPAPMKRRFSRLAGLLEIADDEFQRLRDELHTYAAQVPEQIARSPSTVLIDKVSLEAFVRHDALVSKLDGIFAQYVGAKLAEACNRRTRRHDARD